MGCACKNGKVALETDFYEVVDVSTVHNFFKLCFVMQVLQVPKFLHMARHIG